MDRSERLTLAAQNAGFDSLRSLAKAAGCTHTWISQVLSGRRPGVGLLDRLAVIVDVSSAWLRDGDRADAPAWAIAIYDLEAAACDARLPLSVRKAIRHSIDVTLRRQRRCGIVSGMALNASTRERRLRQQRDRALAKAVKAETALRRLLARIRDVGVDPNERHPRLVSAALMRQVYATLIPD